MWISDPGGPLIGGFARKGKADRMTTRRATTTILSGWVLAWALCACSAARLEVAPLKSPLTADTLNEARADESRRCEGAIWSDQSSMAALFTDPKARQVGDIITIKIVESAKASNQASTDTGRDAHLLASIDSLLGLEQRYTDPSHPKYNPYPKWNPFGKVEGSFSNSFEGKGTTTRSGDLSAYMTARVTEVLPNGNMFIKGTRELVVNDERQTISLSGLVRARDISPDNVILSTYVSDAHISYSGKGIVDDTQRPGWLVRLVTWIWPF